MTVEPVTQDMVKAGVVSFVMLSVLDEPESVAAVRSGVPGAASAALSIVIEKFADAAEAFPAVSV